MTMLRFDYQVECIRRCSGRVLNVGAHGDSGDVRMQGGRVSRTATSWHTRRRAVDGRVRPSSTSSTARLRRGRSLTTVPTWWSSVTY